MDRAVKAEIDTIEAELRWFSRLAEKRGVRSEKITLPSGITGAELISQLAKEFDELNRMKKHVRLAVNQSYAEPSSVIHDGDEVAFITPVSGG